MSHPKLPILRNREAGQTLVLAALGLTVLMLAAGLSIDMGYLRYEKRRMQTAADSAAIAGASDLQYSDWQTSGQTAAASNGYSASNGATVTVNYPWAPNPHAGDPSYVEASVSMNEPTFFMRIAGLTSVSLSASAVARSGNGPGCVYAGAGGISSPDTAQMSFVAQNCGIVDSGLPNSNSGVPGLDPGPLSLGHTASSHSIVSSFIVDEGDSSGNTCDGAACFANNGSGGLSPFPPQKSVPAADPLAYVQSMPWSSPGSCSPPMGPQAFNGVPVPSGSYPCGLTVTGVSTLSGPYFVGGSGISITAGPGNLITGTDVTIYTSGTAGVTLTSTAADSGNGIPAGDIQLSAPSTGSYANVLFYQDPQDIAPAIITLDTNSYVQGALYFPGNGTTGPTLTLGGVPWNNPTPFSNYMATYTILDAYQIVLEGYITINNQYPNGQSPIKDAVLVQ